MTQACPFYLFIDPSTNKMSRSRSILVLLYAPPTTPNDPNTVKAAWAPPPTTSSNTMNTNHSPLYLLYTLTSSGRLSPVDMMGHPRPSSDNTDEACVISALSGYLQTNTSTHIGRVVPTHSGSSCPRNEQPHNNKKNKSRERKAKSEKETYEKYFKFAQMKKQTPTTTRNTSTKHRCTLPKHSPQPPSPHVQQFVVPQERSVGEGVRTAHRHACGGL